MREMVELIQESNLTEELEDRLEEVTGDTLPPHPNYWLGEDGGMDEDSDQDDPEKNLKEENVQLKKESEDRLALCDAVQGALECRAMATDLERARMQLEDLRAQILR